MKTEDFLLDLQEIMCQHVEEPAGRGAGYGISEEGQNEMKELVNIYIENNRKGNKMIKKALHRITVLWCLYGLVRLCIFINPVLFTLWNMVFGDGDADISDPEQIAIVWLAIILAITALVTILATVHAFANWFFNTKK